MRALAYNHLGEFVFVNEAGARFCGKTSKSLEPEPQPSTDPARFLRMSPTDAESIWLCALSLCLQPEHRVMEASAFFKLCTNHLPAEEAKKLLKYYSRCLLVAFVRTRSLALQFEEGLQGFEDAYAFYQKAALHKPAAFLAPWAQHLFEPRALSTLRLAAQELSLTGVLLPFSEADPFDGTVSPGRFNLSNLTPWPLLPDSGLRDPDVAVDPAFVASLLLNDQGSCQQLSNTGGLMSAWDWHLDGLWSNFTPPSSEEELFNRWQALPTKTLAAGRLAYTPLTQLGEADSATPAALWLSQKRLFSTIKADCPAWDDYVSSGLGIAPSELSSLISAEQIDACGLALRAFEHRAGFIVADETGLGKGRILASMARAFLQAGRKVFFITERKTLFTDFWRDLKAVKADTLVSEPFLLHPKGRIYGPGGELLFKAKGPKGYKDALAAGPQDTKLVMSCYSQFNRDLKGHDRWSFAQAFADGALLILDESHNAAGESQTRKNIQLLIDQSVRALFSSATFAKHEDALELYVKAMPFGQRELGLLLGAMPNDSGHSLARAMAQGLSETGSLIRREHAPSDGLQTQIIELPSPYSEVASEGRDTMAHALDALFHLSQAIEMAKTRIGLDYEPVWLKLGGALSRLCRQHNLLSKIDYAAEFTLGLTQKNLKPVLAMESTFESFLQVLSTNSLSSLEKETDTDTSDDQEDSELEMDEEKASFQALFRLALETLAPPPFISTLRDTTVHEKLAFAEQAILNLPAWPASPMDRLIHQLTQQGLKVGEISGRSMKLDFMPNGRVKLVPAIFEEREKIIQAFNSGALDVLILTRAGSTGISLHASADFLDQRQRAFVELEISANASQRMQFLGRVRRKGQVIAPLYYTLSSGAPFERRLLERAKSKMQKLSGLTAASSELSAGSLDFDQTILSITGDRLATEWLVSRPECAKRLGLDLWKINTPAAIAIESPCERLLKRLPLLAASLQDEAYDFLIAGLQADSARDQRSKGGFAHAKGSVLARKRQVWGIQKTPPSGAGPFAPALWIEEWCNLPHGGAFGSAQVQAQLAEAQARFQIHFAQGLGTALRKASNSRAHLLAHPLSQHHWHNLQQTAQHLLPGARIKFSDPASSRPVEGMLLDVHPPKEDWLLYPSQWRLSILIPGEKQAFELTLGAFFADPEAYIDQSPPPQASVWDKPPEKPFTFLSVSGHCVYLRWWAARLGFNAFHDFEDYQGQLREQLILPFKNASSALSETWLIPLLDLRLVISLLQRDPRLALSSSFTTTPNPEVLLQSSQGGWTLSFERSAHERLVDFNLDRRLGPRKSDDKAGYLPRISRFVSPKDIYKALAALHQSGIGFFAPFSRSGWHAAALEDLLIRSPVVVSKTHKGGANKGPRRKTSK